ncbi:WD40 repeat-like protein [Cubamyces sp. BRFM 1775]|nr:WD40 repeat-like protein [Cubamyces sp. BRFM 1775]
MKPADDPYQKHGVPRFFEPLNPPKAMIQGPWEIQNNLFSSKTVKHGNITADLNAASPDGMITAGGGLKFTSSENTGAFLLHTPPAVCMKLVSKRAIVRYMRDNLDHWLAFANDEHGMMLNVDQFYFVHGTVKTSKWACAAFQGNAKSIEGSLQAQVVNSGLNMSISLSTEDATRLEYNFGPTVSGGDASPLQLASGSQESGSPRPPPKRDQCIFINYYKAKKRLLWKPKIIQAAAEPQDIPPGDQDDADSGAVAAATETASSGSDSDVEGEMPDRKPYDPVDFLLDYILENSSAEVAFASDTDLYDLFREAFPEDVQVAINEMKPAIDIDENGAGTIDVEAYTNLNVLGETGSVVGRIVLSQPGQEQPMVGLAQDPVSLGQLATPPAGPLPSGPPVTDAKDDNTGLTPEEAELRRQAKLPVLPAHPAVVGHPRPLTALMFSHDSKLLATGADDGSAVLWRASNQTDIRRWDAHTDVVWSFQFSPDDKRLASASADSTIKVWNVDTGDQIATLQGHTEAIRAMEWSADGKRIASASDDLSVRIWDGETYGQLFELHGHVALITFVKFSHDGRWLASGGADYNCILWNVAEGTLHKTLEGHKAPVWQCDFDMEDRRIVTCSDDASALICSVETGQILLRLHEHRAQVWCVAFTDDGKRVMTASSDAMVKICDSYTGTCYTQLTAGDTVSFSVSLSPDGKYVAAALSDNTVRLWNLNKSLSVAKFTEHDDKATLVMFSADGELLASGADDGTVRIRVANEWDPDRVEHEQEEDYVYSDGDDNDDNDEQGHGGDGNEARGEDEDYNHEHQSKGKARLESERGSIP